MCGVCLLVSTCEPQCTRVTPSLLPSVALRKQFMALGPSVLTLVFCGVLGKFLGVGSQNLSLLRLSVSVTSRGGGHPRVIVWFGYCDVCATFRVC